MIGELLTKYDYNKQTFLSVLDIIDSTLRDKLDKDEYETLCKKIYYLLQGGHYNLKFANMLIPKMYYEDNDGKHFAPYWTEELVRQIYDKIKSNIPHYNFYDFEVTLNMIKSDYQIILQKWFSDNVEDKFIDLALNWLKDEDNPFGNEKVWKYFN